MMQSQSANEEFPDLKSHQAMWGGYTHMLFRGVVGVVALVLFIGWVTGVL